MRWEGGRGALETRHLARRWRSAARVAETRQRQPAFVRRGPTARSGPQRQRVRFLGGVRRARAAAGVSPLPGSWTAGRIGPPAARARSAKGPTMQREQRTQSLWSRPRRRAFRSLLHAAAGRLLGCSKPSELTKGLLSGEYGHDPAALEEEWLAMCATFSARDSAEHSLPSARGLVWEAVRVVGLLFARADTPVGAGLPPRRWRRSGPRDLESHLTQHGEVRTARPQSSRTQYQRLGKSSGVS